LLILAKYISSNSMVTISIDSLHMTSQHRWRYNFCKQSKFCKTLCWIKMVNFCTVCGYCTRTYIVREHLEDTLRICDVSTMGLYATCLPSIGLPGFQSAQFRIAWFLSIILVLLTSRIFINLPRRSLSFNSLMALWASSVDVNSTMLCNETTFVRYYFLLQFENYDCWSLLRKIFSCSLRTSTAGNFSEKYSLAVWELELLAISQKNIKSTYPHPCKWKEKIIKIMEYWLMQRKI
jgi:hypothetical protein